MKAYNSCGQVFPTNYFRNKQGFCPLCRDPQPEEPVNRWIAMSEKEMFARWTPGMYSFRDFITYVNTDRYENRIPK